MSIWLGFLGLFFSYLFWQLTKIGELQQKQLSLLNERLNLQIEIIQALDKRIDLINQGF